MFYAKLRHLLLLISTFSPAFYGASQDVDATEVTVRAIQVALSMVKQVTYVTGEIRPRYQADLSFRVAGRISERFVEVGDVVRKGDLLAKLDAEEQVADVAVARADLASAEATFTQAKLAFERQFPQTKERFRQSLDAEYLAVIEMCAVELESIGSAR